MIKDGQVRKLRRLLDAGEFWSLRQGGPAWMRRQPGSIGMGRSYRRS